MHVGVIRYAMRLDWRLSFWILSQAALDMLGSPGLPLVRFETHRTFIEALVCRMAETFERVPADAIVILPAHVTGLGPDEGEKARADD